MALNEVSLKESASPEHPAQVNPIDKKPEENGLRAEAISRLADAEQVTNHQPKESGLSAEAAPQTEAAKPEEGQKLSVARRFVSKAKRVFSHPFWAHPLVVGALVGGAITQYYAYQQKEADHLRSIQQIKLTSQRSFSDEMNKLRIQKIGEVWEQIDKNEATLDDLLAEANKSQGSNADNFAIIKSIVDEDITTIRKNRFWLGDLYDDFQRYLSINEEIVSGRLHGQPGIDLSEPLKRREQAKQDINRVRDLLLKGEPELVIQPTPVSH